MQEAEGDFMLAFEQPENAVIFSLKVHLRDAASIRAQCLVAW